MPFPPGPPQASKAEKQAFTSVYHRDETTVISLHPSRSTQKGNFLVK